MVDFNIRSRKKAANSATSSLNATRGMTNSLDWGQSAISEELSKDGYLNSQSLEQEDEKFPSLIDLDVSEHTAPEQERMEFALDRTRVTKIKQLQSDVRRWEGIIEVLPFWRIAVNPINVTTALLSSLIMAGLIYLNFSKIPDEMLFYYSQANSSWLLMDKSLFSLVPIGFFVIQLLLLRLKRSVFNFDRRLSLVMALTQVFFSVMGIIATLQILSLVLV